MSLSMPLVASPDSPHMFTLTSTHLSILKAKDEAHEKLLAAIRDGYEAQALLLRAQNADLRSMVFPTYSPGHVPVLAAESDAILSGNEEPIEMTEQQVAEWHSINSEASRVLNGTYDEPTHYTE